MATVRQKKAIDAMVENGGIVSRAMITAGYSEETAKTPQKLTDSIGYKEALAELGLTENFITTALVDDINAKPKRRIKELELGADILGMRKRPEQQEGSKTLIINITGETASRYGLLPKTDL